MAETVERTAELLREAAVSICASRHRPATGDRAELRLVVARLCSAVRWCERRTDAAELWDGDLWRPVLEAELSRRRCEGCGRLRGRAAIAGRLCGGCHPAICDRCGCVFVRAALSRWRGVLVCDGCRCGVCGDRLPDGSRLCSGCIPF